MQDRAQQFFETLQGSICEALQELEPSAKFRDDRWDYGAEAGQTASGGGLSRVVAGGRVFEKAGVNLAGVRGRLTERLAGRLEVEAQEFYATGLSLVVHPLSPMVPTVHMNVRFLQLLGPRRNPSDKHAWFGGGADLTPYYLFDEDARHFHRTWKTVCDRHDPGYYPRFKRACDEYFHNKHRAEARGIGGVFFDYLHQNLERDFAFVQEIGQAFVEAYLPIVERRVKLPWWDRERKWQLIRRGRYVEFNLVYDRGTLFGLETQGRTESILMSLPPLVRWEYDHRPEPGTPEASLLEVLAQPRDWV